MISTHKTALSSDRLACLENGVLLYRRAPMPEDTSQNGKGLSLRDDQKRLTRRRLIEGALAAFERKGYAATHDRRHRGRGQREPRDLLPPLQEQGRHRPRHCRAAWPALARALPRAHVERAPLARAAFRTWLDAMVDNYEFNRTSLDALGQAIAIEPAVAEVNLVNNRESVEVMADSIVRWQGADREDARIRAALLLAQMVLPARLRAAAIPMSGICRAIARTRSTTSASTRQRCSPVRFLRTRRAV